VSYGTVHRNNSGVWIIKTQPQVRLRLKRVFERIDKRGHDFLFLSDTLENCRELLWFLQRFPMDMPEDAREYLRAQAEAYDERQLTIRQVLDSVIVPRAFTMALPPRDYQALAAEMLLRSGHLLCADDVGLGKTALAIAALTDPSTRPALVVALTHLQRQWVAELAKFAPGLRAHILKRGSPYPIEPFPDVIVSSYHKLGGWADVLAPVIKTVVFDEVQELRRTESQKYSAAAHLAANARYRLGLSATPIYNYGSEMYAVMSCIAPDALGSRQEFGREWCNRGDWGDKAKIDDPKAFGSYLRDQGLMLRRTRKDVGRELPEVTRVVHEIDADPHALEAVSVTAAELARTILRQGEAFRGQKLHASEELSMLLRQATGVAKAPHVAAFVRLLCESEGKVVLYGWHKAVYAVWRDELDDLKPVFYTGDESPNEKDASKQAFVAGDSKVLIVSLRAGMGLDGLQQVCRTVVFGELDWSPGVHEQCIGRIHRDGQDEPVLAYFLLADAGSDPVVADINGIKRQQSEAIRDPHAELIEKLALDGGHVRRLAAAYLEQRGLAA
jgi:SNF2 family DNA or RNA helicase